MVIMTANSRADHTDICEALHFYFMKFGSNKSVLKYLTAFPETLKCYSGDSLTGTDEVYNLAKEMFSRQGGALSSNICYWTNPFSKAFACTYEALVKAVFTDKIKCDGHYQGIAIEDHERETTTFYSFDFVTGPNGGDVQANFRNVYFAHFIRRELSALVCATGDADNGMDIFIDPSFKTDISGFLLLTLFKEVFKKYCKLETKLLLPKASFKDFRCKYINLLPDNVTILDSKWFTNLVQSQGFNVRGHFRFQACGSGMQERTLIWIDDFKKDGYRAPARRLLPQNQKFINPVDKPTP